MANRHGVYTSQVDTDTTAPVVASSGISFVVGTAPVHTNETTYVNEPILLYSYAEAVEFFGNSDDWEKYSLCELIYSHFMLYNVSPVVLVNVLDPDKHNTKVTATEYTIDDGKVTLPFEAIADTVVVTDYTNDDFTLFYDDGELILEILETGNIPDTATTLEIAYTKVAPELVDVGDIVGGFDVNTKKNLGLETISDVFGRYGVLVDLIVAPNWSHNSEVATVMGAKAESISGFFQGVALIDVDDTEADYYTDVVAWKKAKNIYSKHQVLCYPSVKLGDRKFHLSTHIASKLAQLDAQNGCPYESPSNTSLQIDTCVSGVEEKVVSLTVDQANYLNFQGVLTAINHIGGYVAWGNYTSCYPSDSDVKNCILPISRVFYWIASTLILTYWSKVDRPMTRRLIDNVVDSTNVWLNGLYAEEKILGGRIEFLDSENPTTSLMMGIMKFHVYITPPSPAQEIEFQLEYDVDYVKSALT